MSAIAQQCSHLATHAGRCAVSRVGAEIATGARAGSSWARTCQHAPAKRAALLREKIEYVKTRKWVSETGCREFNMLQQSSCCSCSSSSSNSVQEPSVVSRFMQLWSSSAKN
eukprot:CAMPEP_0179447650 /NCGR_PEP_ID=MMETSP0799-20121207/31454_1 /TAXON_ID=46947 /ORGANISM="Geminigera cryophila, Strain CCMP2564" /LENGTH=111 /DNA_ID=CAMNT_0021238621 /DNA_START=33 /DNA_END=368 /DNA_ORIENTATION=+